ncbi:Membrane metallo-endopeptidase-like 1 [Dermatophagoides pteronyssinus]|uniref:Membrane metallo-endopeptidase-like 1 n=1 Tax=Dermatophagoides pteronyssinus TaxID=6956 RepID=A0ABQ8IT58_DERPT|nr:Membrane metallo-endopeptidase-like 1 [Dermatophagoides pteronyssinus]
MAMTPESDISITTTTNEEFNPIIREKASSLTLPDLQLQFLRKGSSNPFIMTTTTTTPNNNGIKQQQSLLSSTSNINNSKHHHHHHNHHQHHNKNHNQQHLNDNWSTNQLSVYEYSNNTANPLINNNNNNNNMDTIGSCGSGGGDNIVGGNRLLNSALKTTRGSTISSMTNHRSSYIGEEEHYHLQQHYFATTGRKDTIISIGKNFQIQFKSPSTNCLSWHYRTSLEKFLLLSLLLLLLFILLAYIYIPYLYGNSNEIQVCTSMECVKTSASLLSAMDLNADPCEDFFQFACGNWVKKHIIPEDRSSLSTFEVMADDLQIILKDLLEQVPNSADNSATLKAKRFYQSCMNIQKINKIAVQPILDTLQDVGGWPVLDRNWNEKRLKKTTISMMTVQTKSVLLASSSSSSSSAASSSPASLLSKSSSSSSSSTKTMTTNDQYMELTLENLLGKLRGDYNQPIIVEQYIGPDDRNSSLNIIQFDQTSLGLPSREYFLKENPNKEKDAYLELMIDIAELLGADRDYATVEMSKVLEFETQLANASMPEADRHDTSAIYNKKTIKQLKQLVPEFDWIGYLKNFMPISIDENNEEIVIYSLDYYQQMGKLIKQIMNDDRRIIYNYAIWRLMKSILPFLDNEFGLKRAKFRKILFGISADRTRWSQCVELVNKKMGMAVGALFIRDNFDPKSKEIAIEMIHNIRVAFNELLNFNDWMDNETRQVAKEKADAINERIGYPELLTNPIELSKEYNFLEIHEDKFLQNILNVFRFEAYKNLIKLGTAVDKDSWTTDPAVVNAFYSPNKNDIVFPAGILQPLFYSHYFPKSLNYGGIGVVIGHEITHGFDDRGRQFDKNGNMKQWWNNQTIKRFRERAQCIIDQYSSYVLEDINANVNGRMTQGENIADNGGLKQAYRAFKKWEKQNNVEPLLPGLNLTHDQLFFLNYAQIWCGSMRPEDALNKIRSSVHSPGPIRVLGPLSNSYDFSNAYNCEIGSRMNPVKKCTVW